MDSIVARRTFWELAVDEQAEAPARRSRAYSDSEIYSWADCSATEEVNEKRDSCCSASTADTLSTTGSVEDRWSCEESTASESGDTCEDSASVCVEQSPAEVAQFHPQQVMFSPCVMVPYNHVMMPQAWAYPAAVGLESRARALHHAAATLQAQVQAASATAKSKRKSKAATKRASDKTVPSERTTILLKNLHSSLTRSALLNLLDSAGFSCKYDFVYLPFKLVPNAEVQSIFGYAIVNFCSAADASAAMECLRGVQIESQEVITEWSESQQGHEVLVQRYRDSPVMHESMPEEYQPILLLNGARVEFPAPTRPLQPSRKFAEKK